LVAYCRSAVVKAHVDCGDAKAKRVMLFCWPAPFTVYEKVACCVVGKRSVPVPTATAPSCAGWPLICGSGTPVVR